MSNRNRNQNAVESTTVETTATETPVTDIGANRTAMFHSLHPRVGNPTRASYTIPGVAGNIVIFLSMFKDGVAPASLTLDALLAEPKADAKAEREAKAVARAEEKAAKAIEKAAKAQERINAQAAKAQAILDKAKAAVAAASAPVGDAPTA